MTYPLEAIQKLKFPTSRQAFEICKVMNILEEHPKYAVIERDGYHYIVMI